MIAMFNKLVWHHGFPVARALEKRFEQGIRFGWHQSQQAAYYAEAMPDSDDTDDWDTELAMSENTGAVPAGYEDDQEREDEESYLDLQEARKPSRPKAFIR
jgi:hypothetical protein